jgi:hypothetical protein
LSTNFNRELAAAVLIEAAFRSDADSCSKYGVSLRSLQNYRRRLHEDPELAAIFNTKKALFDRAWADDLVKALKGAAVFIAEAAETARSDEKCKTNPEMIAAMAGALKLCADVHLTSKVLDARLADSNRSSNGLSEQVPTPEYAN